MLAILQHLFCVITTHVAQTTAAVLALVGAALLTYARQQFRAGINWGLAPLLRLFPWNNKRASSSTSAERDGLVSELSLVDVFLCDKEGRSARYQKISSYVRIPTKPAVHSNLKPAAVPN